MVADAVTRIRAVGESEASEVLRAVTELLTALEAAVSSHVDRCEVILACLQSGTDADFIVAILEHGLEVLDMLSASTSRKQRKEILALCDVLETTLEGVDEAVAAQLSTCEASALVQLSQSLCSVDLLRCDESDLSQCMEAVESAMAQLQRCSDPVVASCGQLASGDASEIMRGPVSYTHLTLPTKA